LKEVSYPIHYARGVTRKECLDGETLKKCVFDFDTKINKDGKRELSIQWLVNHDAVQIMKEA